jgi:hypothetical protein
MLGPGKSAEGEQRGKGDARSLPKLKRNRTGNLLQPDTQRIHVPAATHTHHQHIIDTPTRGAIAAEWPDAGREVRHGSRRDTDTRRHTDLLPVIHGITMGSSRLQHVTRPAAFENKTK